MYDKWLQAEDSYDKSHIKPYSNFPGYKILI